MVSKESRKAVREKKHWRMRSHLSGTAQRPRLSVFRSNSHMYAQIIDDTVGRTLVAASTLEKEAKSKLIAERAKEQGISAVVFDRGGFLYTGKIQALADAAREAGLQF